MLAVVGDLAHCLIGRRHVAAEEAFGMHDRACGAQLVPDREGIFRPLRIGVVEIMDPVGHGRMGGGWLMSDISKSLGARGHGRHAGRSGARYSSITSIAISGQLDLASQALSSRPGGTVPSPASWALPYSSSSNSSGASALQRACPWHLSGST